jgi:hypothetical protein
MGVDNGGGEGWLYDTQFAFYASNRDSVLLSVVREVMTLLARSGGKQRPVSQVMYFPNAWLFAEMLR